MLGNDLKQVIAEHVRLTSKGGTIIILIPTLEPYTPNYLNLKLMEITGLHKGAPHFIVTGKNITRQLTDLGCRVETVASLGWLLRWRQFSIQRFAHGKIFSTETIVIAKR